jgi:hypothetical protein
VKTVAIVGGHPKTRDLAPYNDPSIDIWAFNQALGSKYAKRISALFQLHVGSIYKADRFDPKHTELLKQKHDFPIYMLEVDPEIPNSVRYPFENILANFPDAEPQMFTQSTCYALALALYLGYEKVMIYGVENSHFSEYSSEREGFIYWTGYLAGKGVIIERHCGDNMFVHPLYGREKLWVQDPAKYTARLVELEIELRKAKRKLRQATGKSFEEWNEALYELGTIEGQRNECEKHYGRIQAMIKASGEAVLVPSELQIDARELLPEIESGRALMEQSRGARNMKAFGEAALFTSKMIGRRLEIKRMMDEAEKWQIEAGIIPRDETKEQL